MSRIDHGLRPRLETIARLLHRQAQATTQVAVWQRETCPGCGLDVMFLPGQASNTCGHCNTGVTRGVE